MNMTQNPGIDNIPPPPWRSGRIKKYRYSLSSLLAEIYTTDDERYDLIFENVQYFEGPIVWQGPLSFSGIGEPGECVSLLRQINSAFEHMPDDYLSSIFRLYKFMSVNFEIKILGRLVHASAGDSELADFGV